MLSINLFPCGSCNYVMCKAGLTHAEYQSPCFDCVVAIGAALSEIVGLHALHTLQHHHSTYTGCIVLKLPIPATPAGFSYSYLLPIAICMHSPTGKKHHGSTSF